MNYFFKIVIPQMLEVFKENATNVSEFLIPNILKIRANQEDINALKIKANEITKKYKNDSENEK